MERPVFHELRHLSRLRLMAVTRWVGVFALICFACVGCPQRSRHVSNQTPYGLPAGDRVISRTLGVPSPDLKRIVHANPKGWLYVSRLRGSADQPLNVWRERFQAPDQVVWSSDEKRLAVIGTDRVEERVPRYLYVFDINHDKASLIARFPAGVGKLVWSPSSDRICFREANSEDYVVGDINTKTTTRIFSLGSRHATVGFIDKSGNQRPFPRGWSVLSEFFTPVTWLPGDRIVGAILVNVPNADYSWSFPAIVNWSTRSVTILGDQRIVNEGSIVGFDNVNQRLYSFFTKNTDLGAGGEIGDIPGWLSLGSKPLYHLLELPEYYDVSSEKGKKLINDPFTEGWYLVSHDGFLVMDDASAVSSDGRWLALWEKFAKRHDEDVELAVRLVIWDISGSPKMHRAIKAVRKSNPTLFKLLNNPYKFSFTADNKSLIGWFDSGAVIQFEVDQ